MTRSANAVSPQLLSFKVDQELPLHKLPFVGFSDVKQGMSYWNVPRTGGFGGGVVTGKALARIYMKHLADNQGNDGGILQSIVTDITQQCDGSEKSSSRGHVVGFFSEIEKWLKPMLSMISEDADSLDSGKNLESANHGINYDKESIEKIYS
jgi:hypothetical protein